jgi:2,4-dienoyl-CoA reductase-like NADH-dependent reductase (Old Yellow Enzyme family)
MPHLFEPLTLRSVTLRNRVGVSPMCQYSCVDGLATDWHLVHLGSRAVGGAGLVIVEATAVEPRGRISPEDLGLWSDAHAVPLARAAAFIAAQGSVPGIQLAHAGRKASTFRPWSGSGEVPQDKGGWQTVAPSALPFSPDYPKPVALTREEIHGVTAAFVAATRRALGAGFQLIELHGAHGYLGHEFLSPLANHRTDEYGGALENRARFLLETARAVRAAMGEALPLAARLSCTDWAEGGFTPAEAVQVSRWLKDAGVDLIDCSSGGLAVHQKIPVGPGYQVHLSDQVRAEAGIATASVGMITEPKQADEIIRSGKADLVLLARAELNDPYWPIHAALALGQPAPVPAQYARGFPSQRK